MVILKDRYLIRNPKYRIEGDVLCVDIPEMEFVYLHELNLPSIERRLPSLNGIVIANATNDFFKDIIPSEFIESASVQYGLFNDNSKILLDKLFWLKLYSSEEPALGEEWYFINSMSIFPFEEYKRQLDIEDGTTCDYIVNFWLDVRNDDGGYSQTFKRFDYNDVSTKYTKEKENGYFGYKIREDYEWPKMSAWELQAIDRFTWSWGLYRVGVVNGVDFYASLKREDAAPEYTSALENLAKKIPR